MANFFWAALQAMIILAIPIGVNRFIWLLLQRLIHTEFFQVPILTTLASIQGLLAGFMLVRLDFDQQYWDVEQIFTPAGPWDLTLTQFLLQRANIFVYDPRLLMGLLNSVDTEVGLLAYLTLVFIPFAIMVLSLVLWRPSEAVQAMVGCVVAALLAGWTAFYLVSMTMWVLHLINFWSLILLFLYIHFGRDKNKAMSWSLW